MMRPIALLACLWMPIALAEVPVDPVREDVRGTTTSIASVHDTVRALSPAQLQEAQASARLLLDGDPYTKASFYLAFALEREVSALPLEAVDPLVRRDWAHLQAGLREHVAVLAALGVAAPAGDPMDAASQAIAGIPAAVASLGAQDRARLAPHHDRLEALTGGARPCPRGPWAAWPGHPWTLGMHLAGWHDALRRVRPFVEADEAARIDRMTALLDAWGAQALG